MNFKAKPVREIYQENTSGSYELIKRALAFRPIGYDVPDDLFLRPKETKDMTTPTDFFYRTGKKHI